MTYENIGADACSTRGIAHRESREALEALAKELEGKITNIKIEEDKTFSANKTKEKK